MKSSLFLKLKDEIQEASWNMLKVHHKQDILFLVSTDLTLTDVACDVAKDNVSKIKLYQKNFQFRQPNESELKEWEREQSKKIFNFLIIQPFVLIQLI